MIKTDMIPAITEAQKVADRSEAHRVKQRFYEILMQVDVDRWKEERTGIVMDNNERVDYYV